MLICAESRFWAKKVKLFEIILQDAKKNYRHTGILELIEISLALLKISETEKSQRELEQNGYTVNMTFS